MTSAGRVPGFVRPDRKAERAEMVDEEEMKVDLRSRSRVKKLPIVSFRLRMTATPISIGWLRNSRISSEVRSTRTVVAQREQESWLE